jgi:hypothetical protein
MKKTYKNSLPQLIILNQGILLKIIFLAVFICLYINTQAATYYISSTQGDDSRSSTQAQSPNTPWKSLTKLNSFMPNLTPGDVILFKKGDVFEGAINITKSGTSTQPILFSAYGSGSQPVISGFVTLTNWTSAGNGVWESSCSSCGTSVNSVVIDGVAQAMGRYPNSNAPNGGYLSISSHSGNTSISSTQLSSTSNWAGGELVTRTNRWILDRNKITSHSGSTLTYTAASPQFTVQNGYGFFIQNHPGTLDAFGEWYYNSGTKRFRVFFGTTPPASVLVKVSTVDDLVTISRVSHISFKDLVFQGANINGFKVHGGENIQITNSEINNSGVNGITASVTKGLKVTNITISYSNNGALYFVPDVSDAIIQNNIIKSTATMVGMGESGNLKYIGMVIHGSNNLVENNQIKNTGYNAISFMGGSSNHIKNNFIDTFCTLKDDGCGIGTWNNSANAATYTNQKITNNIIINGIGAPQGVASPEHYKAVHGIYMDDNASNVEISGNTVTSCYGTGLFVHNAYNLDVKNNTFFNNNEAQIYFSKDAISTANIRNVNLTNNQFFARTYDQGVAVFKTIADDISLFGTFDHNYYSRPLDDTYIAYTQYVKSGKKQWQAYTLGGWKQAYDKDHSSKKSPAPIQAYTINSLAGSNKVANGSYNSGPSGTSAWSQTGNLTASWNSGGKLDGGAFQAQYNQIATSTNPASLTIPVGAVSNSKHYLVKFSLMGTTETGSVGAYFRKMGAPFTSLSNPKYAPLTNSRSEQEFLVSFPLSESNAALHIELRDQDGTMWLDNVEVHEVNVTLKKPDDYILFEYNASNSSKVVQLNQTYVGINGTTYTGSVELAPHSSIILLKADANTPVNKAPVANAGTNQTVTADAGGHTKITLDGSGSSDPDGSIIHYTWTRGADTVATGIKPALTLATGEHQIALIVTDDNGASASATVIVTVKAAASLPTPTNLTVTGISSSQIKLQWHETSADEEAFILERSTASGFTANLTTVSLPANTTSYQDENLAEGTTYYYRVKAKKGSIESPFSNTILATTNKPPVVSAGTDKTIRLPANTLSITATASDADGKIASWKWTKLTGPNASLSGLSTATLSASSLLEGSYTFQVEVIDNQGASATDQVSVQVEAAPFTTYYHDADGDGYGNNDDTQEASIMPAGYSIRGGDCNDNDATINPDSTEACGNGIDDNCNGTVDEDCTPDQDPATTEDPSISISDITIFETDGIAMATIELSHITTNEVQVAYGTLNGTATHPKDFRKGSGSITVPPGNISAPITVPIIIDNKTEPTEYFHILLSNPVNATILSGSCRVTIEGDDMLRSSNTETSGSDRQLSAQVSPNPYSSFFTVKTQSNSNQAVVIRVMDFTGYLIEEITNGMSSGSYELGHEYRRGTYIVEVIQGNKRVQLRILKI